MVLPAERLLIRKQCELLEVSRSSYYNRPRPESEATIKLMNRLDEIFTDNLDYGSRMMCKVLRLQDGMVVNRKRIRRLMQKMAICAIYPGKNTSKSGKGTQHRPTTSGAPTSPTFA